VMHGANGVVGDHRIHNLPTLVRLENFLHSRIVHHLSGPNIYTLTRIHYENESVDSADFTLPISHFHFVYEFATQILAYMLDSLVRVTRRAG